VEIAHVLTMDLVEYSTLLITEHTRIMAELTGIVRSTVRFQQAGRGSVCMGTGVRDHHRYDHD
jgi:hypothetical protein